METIIANRKTATLRRARKEHRCSECGLPIPCGAQYWEVVLNGSGVDGLKHPDRVHMIDCLTLNLGGNR